MVCPVTGIIHWTEKAMSERVFASAKNVDICTGGSGTSTVGQGAPCKEDSSSTTVDTGAGNVTVQTPDNNPQTSPGTGPQTGPDGGVVGPPINSPS